MKSINKVLIVVDKQYEDKITDKGIILPFFKERWNNEDGNYNPDQHIRRHGTVLSAPAKLPNQNTYFKNPGSPVPKRYTSGEATRDYIANMHPSEQKLASTFSGQIYNPSTYENEFVTLKDAHQIQLQEGDTVYFHFLSLRDVNYVGMTEDLRIIYKVDYAKCYCFVRDNQIHLLNNYFLLDPTFGDGLEELDVGGVKMMGRTKKVGSIELVTTVNEKPKNCFGVVRHVPEEKVKGFTPEVEPGDVITFKKLDVKQDKYLMSVEGEKYYLMEGKKISSVYRDGEVIPVGQYVLIEPEPYVHKGLLERADSVPSQTGKVLAVGEGAEDVRVGTRVVYNPEKRLELDGEDNILVPFWQVMLEIGEEDEVVLSTKMT